MLFQVLGPVEVDGTDAVSYIGALKPRTLLATLLLRANVWVSVDELVVAIWADQQPPASAERNVGTYIWQLRKLLPPVKDEGGQRIESRSGAYRIRVEPGEMDTDRFDSLLAAGTDALNSGNPVEAVKRLEAAASLWRGVPFEGLATAADQPQVARLVEQHWVVRERLVDGFLAASRLPEAIALSTRLTTENPLRESAWTRLIVALRDAGRKADALAAYRKARDSLVDELGIEPGPELQQLHHELLTGNRPETHQWGRPGPAAAGSAQAVNAEEGNVEDSGFPSPRSPEDYLRIALEAANMLVGQEQKGNGFAEPGAALGWLDAERPALIKAIGYFLENKQVASAWQLCSAAHEYVEAGGRLDNWPQLLVRVAAAAQSIGDRYGELVVRNILGITYARDGRLPDASTEFTTALGIAAVTGDRDAEGTILVNLASAEAEFGAPRDAVTHLSRALQLLEDPAAVTMARQVLADLDGSGESTRSAAAS